MALVVRHVGLKIILIESEKLLKPFEPSKLQVMVDFDFVDIYYL